ncbi:MAG: hypothetical protein ACYS0G_12630 [Planctomycetota bacterium]|jgi:hypothetical protein
MTEAQVSQIIRYGTGEQLLLLAVLLGPRVKPAIDRELDRRAVGHVVRRALQRDRRQAA